MMRSPLALAGGLLLLAGCLPAVAFAPSSGRHLGAPSHSRAPTSLAAVREATFGMGCFWEPAESLLKEPGVLGTTVGYTGAPPSKTKAPTYDAVCFGNDWVEGVRVAYDDEVVSYGEVLDYFFEAQKPAYSRQYASIVFASDAVQQKEAEQWKRDNAGSTRDDGLPYDIVEIEPSSAFYRAEEYHPGALGELGWICTMADKEEGVRPCPVPFGRSRLLVVLGPRELLWATSGR